MYMFLLKGGSSNNLGPNQNFLLLLLIECSFILLWKQQINKTQQHTKENQ